MDSHTPSIVGADTVPLIKPQFYKNIPQNIFRVMNIPQIILHIMKKHFPSNLIGLTNHFRKNFRCR